MLQRENPIPALVRQLIIGVMIGAAITLIALAGIPNSSPQNTRSDVASETSSVVINESSGVKIQVGEFAPDFTLNDIDGVSHKLEEYRGNVVLLNFWATWCAPCRLEMPLLEQHSQEFADKGFLILAINLQETQEQVEAFIDEVGLTLPILLDSEGEVSELYRIIGYPSSILVDREGKIQVIHIGIISEPQLHQYLQQVGFSL